MPAKKNRNATKFNNLRKVAKVSIVCDKGRHTHCYSVQCTCPCHKGGLK